MQSKMRQVQGYHVEVFKLLQDICYKYLTPNQSFRAEVVFSFQGNNIE